MFVLRFTSRRDVVQLGRNNAPVYEIVIKISYSAKPRPPGVETPGYFMSSLQDLNSFYYNIIAF